MIHELIRKNRSYRRFYNDFVIDNETLESLVDLARLSASSRNIQALKFILSCDRDVNARIFPSLAWAGYIKGWNGAVEAERPSAYITILGDTKLFKSFDTDTGIAAQSILLGAVEKELGGCMIGSINRKKLREELNIPQQYEIRLVIALGKPKEEVVIEEVGEDNSIEYWRDKSNIHHVPKRKLDDIIVKFN